MDSPFGSFSLSADPVAAPEFSTSTPFGAFGLGTDMAEAQQLQPFIPPVAQQQGMAWWESLVAYGATRAIDNRFGPVNVGGQTSNGSFAGQNGRTYVQTPSATSGTPAARAAVATQQSANNLGGLLALAAAAFAFF